LDKLVDDGRITLVYPSPLLHETLGILERPKILKHLKANEVQEVFAMIRVRGIHVDLTTEVQVCRDPEDEHLLALCQDGDADFLLSGDKDLLVLKRSGRTQFVSPAELMRKYQ